MTRRRGSGFTLAEALVTAAVVVVLFSAVFGVIGQARDRARRDACQGNEKQFELMFKKYLQDSDQRFPPPDPNRTNYLMCNAGGWADSLEPCQLGVGCNNCPSESHSFATSHPKEIDYGYNASLGGKSSSSIANSAHLVLLFEGNQQAGTAQTARSSDTSQVVVDRHLNGSNYTFVDGHVKWLFSNDAPTGCYAPGAALASASVFCVK